MFGSLVKGAMSVTELEEGIYSLEFSGDDGFDEFLDQGGAADASDLAAYNPDFFGFGPNWKPEGIAWRVFVFLKYLQSG